MPGPTTEVLHDSDTDDDDHRKTLDPARATDIEEVLRLIQQKKWTLGAFLEDLFTIPEMKKKDGNPQTQTQMVSIFLQGQSKVKAQDIAELMHTSWYSAPKAIRDSVNRRASEAKRSDKTKMARWGLQEWAINKVEKIVESEAETVSSKVGGFHLADKEATWDFALNFGRCQD
jgi:hypothetical protein